MRTNTYFLLIALLLVTSCMEPSEQMNNETGELRDPRSNHRVSRLNEEQQHRLLEIYRNYTTSGFYNFSLEYHQLPLSQYMSRERALDSARYLQRLRDNERLPDVNWAHGFEDELIDLYLHDPRVNRNPAVLYRIWRQLHPNLPNIGQRNLHREVLRLYNRREIIRGRQAAQQEVISVNESAPSTPRSETGSEIEWEDMHSPSSSRLRSTDYESNTTEASSSSPQYPRNPRIPRYPHSR